MGCWVSKNKPKKTPNISRTHNNGNSKSPPPTHPLPEEEETVKEVLSESTISKPKPKPIPNPPTIFKKEISPFIRTAPLLSSTTLPTYSKKQNAAVFMPEDFSDLGSTVSVSESLSLSNVTEKRETEEVFHEVRQKSPARFNNNNNRSFSGEVKREGKSPGRRSEQPSPERFGSGYVKRRESGESSGRRSRSPVTCMGSDNGGGALKPGLGRSLSSRKTGKSPSRVGSGLGERIRKMEEGGGDKKWAPTSNDTLENPLVSLECFIFL